MTTALSDPRQNSIDTLKNQLEQPQVAAALSNLLDHADLLAILLVGLDGLVSRSETIGEALLDGVQDLRQVADANPQLEDLDPGAILGSLLALSSSLPKLTPAITRLVDAGLIDGVLDSGITSPIVLDQISKLGRGLASGAEQAAIAPVHVPGAFGLLKLLKDPDINRGLGFFLSVVKAIGGELGPVRDQTAL